MQFFEIVIDSLDWFRLNFMSRVVGKYIESPWLSSIGTEERPSNCWDARRSFSIRWCFLLLSLYPMSEVCSSNLKLFNVKCQVTPVMEVEIILLGFCIVFWKYKSLWIVFHCENESVKCYLNYLKKKKKSNTWLFGGRRRVKVWLFLCCSSRAHIDRK